MGHPTKTRRRQAVAAVVLAFGPLVGCASGTATGGPSSVPAVDSGPTCASFALSIAAGVAGARSPELAARRFIARPAAPGYHAPAHGWTRKPAADGAVLRADGMTLHVWRMPDGTWVVDSGRLCR